MDKGGLAHLLTARLWAIRAIQARNPDKLGKVISVLNQYTHCTGAMHPVLMKELQRLYGQIVREAHNLSAMVIEQKELAHA